MIDETRQELAALYVLRMLPPGEMLQFAKEVEQDAELRALVEEFEDTAGTLAHAAPLRMPPPELKSRVMDSIRRDQRIVPMPAISAWLPWALAACALITTGALWFQNATLREQNRVHLAELDDLRGRDALASVRIATLSAKVTAYEKALAVVVYDPKAQRGLLKLADFPAPAAGKDYQLWVIEPGGAAPVSAGVVPVQSGGATRVAFHPERKISGVDAFAISVEQSGGSPSPKGQIVFVGN
jgi:anti-sigma-K factor RskA